MITLNLLCFNFENTTNIYKLFYYYLSIMFKKNIKAISGHLILLFIISIIMTFFITFITDSFYGNDSELCKQINLDFTSCKKGNSISIEITSGSYIDYELIMNGDINHTKKIFSEKENSQIRLNTRDRIITIVPAIRENSELLKCKGKTKKINKEIIPKC